MADGMKTAAGWAGRQLAEEPWRNAGLEEMQRRGEDTGAGGSGGSSLQAEVTGGSRRRRRVRWRQVGWLEGNSQSVHVKPGEAVGSQGTLGPVTAGGCCHLLAQERRTGRWGGRV